MRTINEYKKRFNQLIESTIGNVKPLIIEQVMLTSEQEAWLDYCTGREEEGGIVSMFKFGDRPTFIGARTWNVDNRGYVTVEGEFYCGDQNLTDFNGVKFTTVTDHFNCARNKLTSLEGAPQTVGGEFLCNDNNLTNLVGAPQKVVESFYCHGNNLTSLEGGPKTVGKDFIYPAALGTPDQIKQELKYQNINVVGEILGF